MTCFINHRTNLLIFFLKSTFLTLIHLHLGAWYVGDEVGIQFFIFFKWHSYLSKHLNWLWNTKKSLLFFCATWHARSYFPYQGWNPCLLQWKLGILITRPPGNSKKSLLLIGENTRLYSDWKQREWQGGSGETLFQKVRPWGESQACP